MTDFEGMDLSTEELTEMFEFLDDIRESGVTNMLGASPYLMNAFNDLNQQQSRAVLSEWMETFSERHKE